MSLGSTTGTVVVGGYIQLIESLSKGLEIRFDSPVRQVTHNSTTARVILASGEVITAQHLLVTVGLGARSSRFQDRVPASSPHGEIH